MKYIFVISILILLPITSFASTNYEDFKNSYHLQIPGTNESFDIKYDVQRNLFDVNTETLRKSIVFTFAGKANNDIFTVILPENLIQGPFTIWLDKTQITNFEVEKIDNESVLVIPLLDITEQVTIVGTKIAGTYTPKESQLINKIHGEIADKIYVKGDDIVVSGNVENRHGLNNVVLSIVGPKGNTIILNTLQINNDAKFTNVISTDTGLWYPGTYKIKISGADASPYSKTIQFENFLLPKWLKINAGWWSENQIDDKTFATGIQYMIKEQIIRIPEAKSQSTSTVTDIPSWVKTNAAWWHEGRISDSDFIVGIQFLIENGIISTT